MRPGNPFFRKCDSNVNIDKKRKKGLVGENLLLLVRLKQDYQCFQSSEHANKTAPPRAKADFAKLGKTHTHTHPHTTGRAAIFKSRSQTIEESTEFLRGRSRWVELERACCLPGTKVHLLQPTWERNGIDHNLMAQN
jgi:hypothetical protein